MTTVLSEVKRHEEIGALGTKQMTLQSGEKENA